MTNANQILLLVGFCMNISMLTACMINKDESHNERTKTMNTQNTPTLSGRFSGRDKMGTPITLEWQKTSIVAPEFATEIANLWDIGRKAYTPVEMQFLRAFPEVVQTEPYFKAFEPLFKDGIESVDWTAATNTMESMLKNHFVFDVTKFSEQMIKMYENDTCYFVMVKDASTQQIL